VDVESNVEPDGDESAVADEVVDAGEDGRDDDPLGDELDAESADELDGAEFEFDDEDDDKEPADDVEELESGSANAMPGMVATAIPIPSMTATAPTRPRCFALPIVGSSSVRTGLRWAI
jgi:hypothetical protein